MKSELLTTPWPFLLLLNNNKGRNDAKCGYNKASYPDNLSQRSTPSNWKRAERYSYWTSFKIWFE